MDRQNIEAKTNDWSTPVWVKAAVTFFVFSGVAVFVLSLFGDQKTFFGLSTALVVRISLGFLLFAIPIAIAFWLFPRSAPIVFFYWWIRFFRKQICVLALLGMVILLAAHASPFSLRGSIPAINLLLLLGLGLFVQPAGPDCVPFPWMRRFFVSFERSIDKINSIPAWVLTAIAVLLPIVITCITIYWGLHSSLSAYGPYSSWEDETAYWVRVRSFSQVGFNAGYNAANELVAPAAFNHYGENSPFYIYLYGSIARLTGWFSPLPILINFLILAAAIFLFIYFAKLDPQQIVFTGLIAVLTWPILAYLPMSTQETLNQAIGFILAILFLKLLTQREQISLPARVLFIGLVYLAALIRLSWGLLLIPIIFYSLNGKAFGRVFWAILLGSGLYISAMLISSYLLPPINNSISLTIKESLVHGPQVFVARIAEQFTQMFRSGSLNANSAVLFQMAVIVGWNLVRLVRALKSRVPVPALLQSRTVFDIYNMGSLGLAGLLFYIQEGFHRTFFPSLLIVYLLQAARKDYKFLVTLLALNIVFFSYFLGANTGAAKIIKANFTTQFPQRAALQAQFEKWIVFDSEAQNPWCNTVLIPLDFYDRRLIVIPPGIGISFIADERISSVSSGATLKTPVKSKYLLFDQTTYESLADRLHAKFLGSSAVGNLYYNLDSSCEFNP